MSNKPSIFSNISANPPKEGVKNTDSYTDLYKQDPLFGSPWEYNLDTFSSTQQDYQVVETTTPNPFPSTGSIEFNLQPKAQEEIISKPISTSENEAPLATASDIFSLPSAKADSMSEGISGGVKTAGEAVGNTIFNTFKIIGGEMPSIASAITDLFWVEGMGQNQKKNEKPKSQEDIDKQIAAERQRREFIQALKSPQHKVSVVEVGDRPMKTEDVSKLVDLSWSYGEVTNQNGELRADLKTAAEKKLVEQEEMMKRKEENDKRVSMAVGKGKSGPADANLGDERTGAHWKSAVG